MEKKVIILQVNEQGMILEEVEEFIDIPSDQVNMILQQNKNDLDDMISVHK